MTIPNHQYEQSIYHNDYITKSSLTIHYLLFYQKTSMDNLLVTRTAMKWFFTNVPSQMTMPDHQFEQSIFYNVGNTKASHICVLFSVLSKTYLSQELQDNVFSSVCIHKMFHKSSLLWERFVTPIVFIRISIYKCPSPNLN